MQIHHFNKLQPIRSVFTELQFYVFPGLAAVVRFPGFGSGLHVFPRLVPVAPFPAHGTGCTFIGAWKWLYTVLLLCKSDWSIAAFVYIY